MPRSSRLNSSNPPKRFHPDDSELETDSEAESLSDYQVTSNSEEERCSTPDSQKDAQCGVCKKNVNSSDKSLQCDTCSDWCHIKAGTLFVFSLTTSLQYCRLNLSKNNFVLMILSGLILGIVCLFV